MMGHEPLPRYRHISESVRNRILVHGGRTKDFSEKARNQLASVVESFNPFSETWEQKQVDGEAPPPGTCEAASASIRHHLFAFGGLSSTKESNALHRLDTKQWRWSRLAPQNAEGAPLPKFGCGMVAFSSETEENLGVFGGHALPQHQAQQLQSGTFLKNKSHADGSGFTNEFHIFDLMRGLWSCPAMTGDIPPPCSHFTFTALESRRAVLFGGFNTIQGFMNDAYIVDLNNKASFHHKKILWTVNNREQVNWIKLQKPKDMDWPAGRSAHAACCLNYGDEYPQLLITGGMNGQSMPFTDIWILDIRLRKWKMMVLSEPLKPRWGHTVAATYLKPGLTELTMFGGTAIPWKGSDERQPKLAETTILECGVVENHGNSQWELLSVSLQQKSPERVYNKMRLAIDEKLPAVEDDQERAMERAHQERDNAYMRLHEAEKERDRARKKIYEVETEIKRAKSETINIKEVNEKMLVQLHQTEIQKNNVMDSVLALQAERDRVQIQMGMIMKEKIEQEQQLRSAISEKEQAKFDRERAITEKMQAETKNWLLLQNAEQRSIIERVDEHRKLEDDTLKVMVEKQQATGERDFARTQTMHLEQAVENLKAEREEIEKKRERELRDMEKEKDHMIKLNQDMQEQRDRAVVLAKQLEAERDAELAEKLKMQEQRNRAMVWAQQAEADSASGKIEIKQAQEERDRAKHWAQQAENQKKEVMLAKLQAESNVERAILEKMDVEQEKQRAIFELQNTVNEAKNEKAMRVNAENERDKLMNEKHEAEEALIKALGTKEQAEREMKYALACKKQVEKERDNALVYKELAERARDFAEMKWGKADGEIERLLCKGHVAESERCGVLMDILEKDREMAVAVAQKQHAENECKRAMITKEEAEEEKAQMEMELQQALLENERIYQEKKQAEIDRNCAQEENASLRQERSLLISEKLQMVNERDLAMNGKVEAECRAEELQKKLTQFEAHEQEQITIREQALNADLRGPSWEVKDEELEIIDESLGSGGWAEVKVAHLKVAAKCLHPQLVYEYHTDSFKREMSIAAKISHPNLLRFLGARLEGGMAILTEFMPTSLRAEINRCYLGEEQHLSNENTLSIGIDVSCALNYLHSFTPDPIVHRDVSSGNVLLQPIKKGGWFAKLSDYGTANFNSQLQTQNPGNPVYTAPEASDPSQQTTKMDVFSFGVLLIEMCKCEFPTRERRSELLESIKDNTIQALIVQCLSEDQVQRPSAAQLVSTLQTIQREL